MRCPKRGSASIYALPLEALHVVPFRAVRTGHRENRDSGAEFRAYRCAQARGRVVEKCVMCVMVAGSSLGACPHKSARLCRASA